jgi:hypothetical protein
VRRTVALFFVFGLLLVGALLTAQAAREGVLLKPYDVLSPEASVFIVTPDQKVMLVGISAAVTVVAVGLGLACGIGVRLLDKAHRQAVSKDS